MGRMLALGYGLVAYLVFLSTFLYAIGFVTGVVVPKTVDAGTVVSAAEALVVNILLLSLFAVQHSVMARKPFKRWWTQFVSAFMTMRPHRTFHPLPKLAMEAPPENFAYGERGRTAIQTRREDAAAATEAIR